MAYSAVWSCYLICDDSDLLQYEGELVVDTEATVRGQARAVLLTRPATSTLCR